MLFFLLFFVAAAIVLLVRVRKGMHRHSLQRHFPHIVLPPEKEQRELYRMLRIVQMVFETHGIKEYWAIDGTLLGARRHGGILPWDDDIDIAVADRYALRLHSCAADWFAPFRLQCTPYWFGYKIHFRNQSIESPPFVDLFLFRTHSTCAEPSFAKARTVWPRQYIYTDELFPLRTCRFGNGTIRVPHNTDAYLTRIFGPQWQTEAIVYNHDLQNESVPIRLTDAQRRQYVAEK